jgi:hypothetical protein
MQKYCTDSTNNRNIIAKLIKNKKSYKNVGPLTLNNIVDTDIDHFPYTRYFRGIATCNVPRIMDREAGRCKWNILNPIIEASPQKLRHHDGCFQIPCSTILPCSGEDPYYKKSSLRCIDIAP